MVIISYKDWIAGKRHLKGRAKKLQEDILSDDLFPDSTHHDEMLSYLKKQNASRIYIRLFNDMYYYQYRYQVLDKKKREARQVQ